MKRAAVIVAATLAASLFVGCASNNSDLYSNTTGTTSGPRGKVLGGIADPPPMSVKDNSNIPEQEPAIAAQTFFAAGQFAEAEGNFAVAAQQYEKACQAQPDYLWAQYRLGVVYSHMKNWTKAVGAWNAYIESTNGTASAWSNLGFTWELAGDPARAEEAYQKGIAKDPTCQPARVNYGLMLARRNRVPEAVEQFSAALTPAEVHYNLASVFEQQGRHKLARAEYEMALKLDPQLSDARTRLAAISPTE
jgi:tetratricopeptide (TPR) repeat protein